MKVLVTWADDVSTNLGVRALASGTQALVQRAWPDADVSFLAHGNHDAPMRVGSPKALLKEAVTSRNGLRSWFRRFDLVVDARGGDSFTDIYGLSRLMSMSALAEFAHRAGVPVVLGPQTIGPFTTRRGRMIARRTMSTARAVMARDPVSFGAARDLNRPADVLTTDVVFALPAPPREVTRDVVLNVSGLLWNPGPHVDHRKYRATVTQLYDAIVASGRTVSLLAHVLDSPQSDNDVPAIREFAATRDHEPELIIPGSLSEVRTAVASAAIVIGSRMHACLNALSVGTPAIALAYSRKFQPLLNDLGWTRAIDLRSEVDPVRAVVSAVEDPSLEHDAEIALHRAHDLLGPAVETLAAAV